MILIQRLKNYQGLALFLLYPLVLTPLPQLWVDLLCTASLIISVIVFILTAKQSTQTLRWLPTILEISAVFRLCLYAPIARLILGQPTALDDWLLRPVGALIAQDTPVGLLVGFGIFAGLQLVVIPQGVSRISEVSARFALDSLPGRQLEIEQKFTLAEITRPEADRLQAQLSYTTRRLGKIDASVRFLALEVRIGVAVSALILLLGSAHAIFWQSNSPAVAFSEYLQLAVGAHIVCVTPLLIMIVATVNLMRDTLPE